MNLQKLVFFADWKMDPQLFTSVKCRCWKEAQHRLQTHPYEAAYVDKHGFTSLHYAALRGAPVELIRSLISKFPTACLQYNIYGKLPLHMCCKCLDLNSVLSLHTLLLFLSNRNEIASIFRSEKRENPIEILCHYNSESIKEVLNESTFEASKRHLVWDHQFRIFWIKLCLLLKYLAVSAAASTVTPWNINHSFTFAEKYVVHAAIEILWDPLVRHPSSLFELVIRQCSHQLQEPNSEGNLPLHIAAGSIATCFHSTDTLDFLDHNNSSARSNINAQSIETLLQPSHPIVCLVNMYPKAAMQRNFSGRLPLHLAIRSCIDFLSTCEEEKEPICLNEFCDQAFTHFWTHGLFPIIAAFPEALNLPEQETQLLPFMMCATTAVSEKIHKNAHMSPSKGSRDMQLHSWVEVTAVSIVYTLLRTNPSIF